MAKEDDNQNQDQDQDQLQQDGTDLEIVLDDGDGEDRKEGKRGQDDDGDERRAKSGGEDRNANAEDKDDESLTPEEREKRRRRREERQLRKQRREEERRELEELRAANAELRSQIGQIDRRVTTSEYRRVEAALVESNRQMEEAQRLINEAKAKENWAALDDAREAYLEARERATNLEGVRQRYIHQAQQGQTRSEQAPDPDIERRAREWRSRNTWYDPNRRDADSKIAAVIDEQLAEDGFDPRTERYWKELDKRLAKQLPHRARTREDADELDDDLDGEQSPTSGSGRERAPSGKRVYKVNAERKEALIEMGIVDKRGQILDKKAMARMVKRFQDWDKQNAHLFKQGR